MPENSAEPIADAADGTQPEYRFDCRRARPNRFALPEGSRVAALDPDADAVFVNQEQVNSLLRARP